MDHGKSAQSVRTDPDHLDTVLARVPELACEAAFDGCLLSPQHLQDHSGSAPARVTRAADAEWMARVHQHLERRREQAEAQVDVETAFLCRSLLHFLPRIPAREHPFVIALYLRSLAQRDGLNTDPPRVGAAMDHYSAMLERDQHDKAGPTG